MWCEWDGWDGFSCVCRFYCMFCIAIKSHINKKQNEINMSRTCSLALQRNTQSNSNMNSLEWLNRKTRAKLIASEIYRWHACSNKTSGIIFFFIFWSHEQAKNLIFLIRFGRRVCDATNRLHVQITSQGTSASGLFLYLHSVMLCSLGYL